ncbi:bifunctional DNA-formamidopyrimidine glycosylase/DNA-(apurinic or apyrimidinic site) lyase [Paenibacillus sp. P96]|uniref:Formamidopyrimidine-DNA glycosylase n=1 Tax=Paenibacillus zeirhizosphaerae TaxID=2987519 RepID=A0ABT9FV72_9BACL|nr:bifunctional DNA-formamidopyrimidine glycosylase/DNA-(apurinic or apyrimidinic site) lyase [Paenibacillus sp. P96]MDP4098623.1 bifunctional DNA-formamidopyrimidine glycosylase/DNA-(apurinic or apyrimidinic site) lyase [Paenibacillus sp. P96]
MPELPEMENYRALLSGRILDKPITGVTVNREKSINLDADVFHSQLLGSSIVYIERRGKHLIFHLNTGKRLLLHLMLGGMLYVAAPGESIKRSTQVEIEFGGETLLFIGLRLGFLHLLNAKETIEALAGLGPEPLDPRMTLQAFASLLKGRRGSLKSTLINQHVIAGIGNCYADEIAFEAGLAPASKMQNITASAEQVERLYEAVRSVLQEAYMHGGYMEMPLMQGDSKTGGFDEKCQVYDREGEACSRCGGTIRREEQAGRKVFYCPDCQHEV